MWFLGTCLDHRVHDHRLCVQGGRCSLLCGSWVLALITVFMITDCVQGGRRSLLCGSWVLVLITVFMITDCVSREVGALSYVVLGYCLDHRAHDHRQRVKGGGRSSYLCGSCVLSSSQSSRSQTVCPGRWLRSARLVRLGGDSNTMRDLIGMLH